MGVNADGRVRPSPAVVCFYPCALKLTLRAGKDIYLEATCLSSSHPGFHKLVIRCAGYNLVSQPCNGFCQGLQY